MQKARILLIVFQNSRPNRKKNERALFLLLEILAEYSSHQEEKVKEVFTKRL